LLSVKSCQAEVYFMRMRRFGKTERTVSVVGFGAMSLSLAPPLTEDAAVALLHQVTDLGVTFIDVADTYCPSPAEAHHNERLVAKALAGSRQNVMIATKGGTVRTAKGWEIDGNPERLYQAICESYKALGAAEPIALWQHHWPDPRYQIVEMLRPVRRALDERLVEHVGVGNYSLEQLKQACDFLPIVSIQNQYNLWHRTAESDGLFEFCVQNDLVFLPWRPLGGAGLADQLSRVAAVAEIAESRGVSPQQVIIAWQLHQSPCLLPIPGSRCISHVSECVAAAEFVLDARELDMLNRVRAEELPRRGRPPAWTAHPPLADFT
jgi:aryl-alcohol dehydrogenase-like predicted oxidoreductase